MEIQYINQFFKENSSQLKLNYKLSVKLAGHDAIHDLRVNIKRLNALFQVLNYQKYDNYRLKESFQLVRNLFKISGPLRDAQVLEALLHNYSSDTFQVDHTLLARVQIEKNEVLETFFKLSSQFNYFAIGRLFRIMEQHIKLINQSALQNYLMNLTDNNLKLISIFSNPKSKAYNLHSARKRIKELGYFLEMSGNNKDGNNQLALCKEAGRYLGDWHDRLVLQQFLSQKSIKSERLYGNTKQFLEIVLNEKNVLKENYFSVLPLIIDSFSQIIPATSQSFAL